MSYLDDLAVSIREQLPPEVEIPEDSERLFILYALLARVKGHSVTAEDVHDAWVAWMGARDPEHPSLIPFENLDPSTQAEDEPFLRAVRAVIA